MKKCSKCGIEKNLNEFYNTKKGKHGVKSECKCCKKISNAEYNADPENKARQKEINAKRNADPENKARQKERDADPVVKASRKEYYALYNADSTNKERKHELYANPANKARRAEHQRERKKSDPLYKLSSNIRTLICNAITSSGFKKTSKTHKILCCSFEEFQVHIENQFTEGMSWDNYPEWQYDHIYPVSLAESEEHLIQLNHYTNFQPLWAADNIRKGNKLPEYLNTL